jgi:hypothetical protein
MKRMLVVILGALVLLMLGGPPVAAETSQEPLPTDQGQRQTFTAGTSGSSNGGVAPNGVTSATCNFTLGAYEGSTSLDLNFYGYTSCAPPLAMSGGSFLYSSLGTRVATGTTYSCPACSAGISQGSYFPAVPGTSYTLNYYTNVVAPPGEVWVTADPSCTGLGTPYLSCDFYWTFVW